MNVIAAYLRCSSPKRLARQSTDSQRVRLSDYARSARLPAPTWYEDCASGRSVKRTALQELLEACQRGYVTQILVTDLSRSSLSVRDTLKLITELTQRGVTLTCVNHNLTFDRSAMPQFVLTVFAALAE